MELGKQMSLKQAAKFDKDNEIGSKQTGWGVVSSERASKKISRKTRIATGNGKNGGKSK